MGLHASSRVGNVGSMARVMRRLPPAGKDALAHRRQMVAEFCRLLGSRFSAPVHLTGGLRARHAQTLERLLEGDSEKQIARRLGVSQNTVHVYVTFLYRHFDVSSRGELLARFVRPPGGGPRPRPFARPHQPS